MAKDNLCPRCGKERVVKKIWTEVVGGSLATFTETICPDKECQKIVERNLNKKRLAFEKIKNASLARRQRKSIHF